MLKKFLCLKALIVTVLFLASDCYAIGPCSGRFPNPITDVCWDCIFPIKIGSAISIGGGETDNHDAPPPDICACSMPVPPYERIGIGISFWEPARIAEVVRTPMCSPTLNGSVLGEIPAPMGTHHVDAKSNDRSFYHVHWLSFPLLSWFNMLTDMACLQPESFDIAYMSELDIMWDDDELTFLLNPEAVLFGNPVAQLACAADSLSAAATNFGIDSLFWCAGSQGSVYPLDGNALGHIGGVDTSLAMVHRQAFKLHRAGAFNYSEMDPVTCNPIIDPIMKKTQYKQQMLYPIPQTFRGFGLGVPSVVWVPGREFPYKGEDFTYLMWRKRKCCAF